MLRNRYGYKKQTGDRWWIEGCSRWVSGWVGRWDSGRSSRLVKLVVVFYLTFLSSGLNSPLPPPLLIVLPFLHLLFFLLFDFFPYSSSSLICFLFSFRTISTISTRRTSWKTDITVGGEKEENAIKKVKGEPAIATPNKTVNATRHSAPALCYVARLRTLRCSATRQHLPPGREGYCKG